MCYTRLYGDFQLHSVEKMRMAPDFPLGMEMVGDSILVRRPALPRWWDPVARPHVAIVVEDANNQAVTRYYLSTKGDSNNTGRIRLAVAELDEIASTLPDGTILEVRFSATKANLYKLKVIDGIPCWRWVGRCRGLYDFEYPSTIDWNCVLSEHALTSPNGIVA
jgi:hypothetical protein